MSKGCIDLDQFGHPTQSTSHLTQSTKQTSDWCYYDPWWKLSQWGGGGIDNSWSGNVFCFSFICFSIAMFVWLTMALSRSFKEDYLALSSFSASLLQAIDGVISLALCLQVVSQASQHFISSEKQAISEGCFAHQSVCSVVSLHKLEKSAHLH